MFGWFKKKSNPQSEAVCQKLLQFQKPMILVQALAEEISEYYKAVKSGKSSAPAYQRKDDSVVGIWRDTRLEVLRQLWGYGASEPTLLADRFQQKKLLYAFFENKPQYEYSHQPSGDPLHDTLQALFHVYLLLEKAGTAVGDKETDGLFLKCVAKKTIFSDFEEDAKVLRADGLPLNKQFTGRKAFRRCHVHSLKFSTRMSQEKLRRLGKKKVGHSEFQRCLRNVPAR